MQRLLGLTFLCLATTTSAHAGCVVLLHGLARGEASFSVMEHALNAHGFSTVNHGYPSTEETIDALLSEVSDAVNACGPQQPVHFVTHSMGGILLRAWAGQHGTGQIDRVVMLGPPNGGSELVDALKDLPLFEALNGPAGRQLGTDGQSVPLSLGPAEFELGIIAGGMSLNPIYSALVPGQDDGKVSLKSTRLEGMADHVTVSATHTFMMNNPVAIAETLSFLKEGRFCHGLTWAAATRAVFQPDAKPVCESRD